VIFPGQRTAVVLTEDRGQHAAALLAALPAAERALAAALPTERRRRHFALGREAARITVRRLLGGAAAVEVRTGAEGEPVVRAAGVAVEVSIAHSGRLAAACAWHADCGGHAGVDLERVRPSAIGRDSYAFSARERARIRAVPEGEEVAGLAAWTVKEAVWKALRGHPSDGPAEIEVSRLDLGHGEAAVRLRPRLRDRLGDGSLRVRVGRVQGPDGPYLLSVAEVRRARGVSPP
jgi:phosphopantetheinyl transferase